MKLVPRKSSDDVHAPQLRPAKRARSSFAGDEKKARAKNKKSRFVLIVGDDGAILVFMQGNTVVRRLFAPSPRSDHTASIVELMQANPKVPLSILADVIDQQYVRHSFPPVSSFSVNGLVQRRLDRDFQAEDLTGAMSLGRDKTGRKEWNYLLIALANTALMQQWTALIVELPNELKGIYLSPVEGQNYLPTLIKGLESPAAPWQLLVTHNKVSGFRQIVLKDGKLVFTRVTQAIDDGVAAVIAGNIEQEIINTIEYLRRLGFQENSQLGMVVITASEVKEVLDVKRFQAGFAHVLTPLDVADMLGFQQAALSADRFGDVVMAAWFAHSKKRVLRLLTAYAAKLSKLYLVRRGMIAAVALAVLAILATSVVNVVASLNDNNAAVLVEQQRVPLKTKMATLKSSLDGLDKNVAFKSAVVSAYDAYMKDARSPLDFVADMAPYISQNFRLEALTWGKAAGTAALGAAGATVEVHATLLISGNYADVEALTTATDGYIARLKAGMTAYDITVGPYPWLAKGGESMEISLGTEELASPIDASVRKIELTFHGPKTPAAASPVAPTDPMGM